MMAAITMTGEINTEADGHADGDLNAYGNNKSMMVDNYDTEVC